MVFAISRACSRLKAKSCTPLWVVSDSTMMSGCFSGQPVAKAVTKSADVDRSVIGFEFLCAFVDALLRLRDVGGDFDFDLGPEIDEPVDIEQRRRWKIASERFLPGCANAGAGRLVFAAAGEIPGQAYDVFGAGARLSQQLDDPFQGRADLGGHVGVILPLLVAAGLA